ncbi:hypothetical protein ACJX0J_034097, partial [Zea mays]
CGFAFLKKVRFILDLFSPVGHNPDFSHDKWGTGNTSLFGVAPRIFTACCMFYAAYTEVKQLPTFDVKKCFTFMLASLVTSIAEVGAGDTGPASTTLVSQIWISQAK